METPPPNGSLKASLSPPVGGRFHSFRRDWQTMFIQRTAIPFKTKYGQISSDSVRIQGPSKRPSSGHLYPVSSVQKTIERVKNVKCFTVAYF